MPNQEDLLRRIAEKYDRPDTQFIGNSCGGAWSIWVHGFHIHLSRAYGSFSASGVTLEEAAKRLLSDGKKYPVIKGDHCDKWCPHYIWDID